jgi:ABC-2 type transport system permease protein
VTARPLHTFLSRAEPASAAALALGSLDVAFLLIYGLPIVVLGIAFNAASREREAGTLALAAAQGVPPRDFIGAKWLARMLLTTTVVVAAVALCSALAWRGDATSGLADLVAWIAIVAGYAAFWFALSLFVNARGASSDRNGVVLTGWWVTFVVLLPALAALVVTSALPPPSRVDLTTMLREASESADKAAASARDKYFFDHPDLAGQEIDPDEFYRAVAASEEQVSRAVAPALSAFDAQARRQQRLVDGLQYLSPAMIVQQGLLAASGTDSARYEDFRAQVAAFHARWREYFVARLERRARLAAADYDAAPAFDYRAPPAAERWRRLAMPLAVLYGATALLVAGAWVRLRRQPVV